MSAQDKTEQVLRDIHILLSKSEAYDRTGSRVIVDKKEILLLLQRLNVSVYEMMDERGLTEQKRDAAEREFRRKGEGIIADANHKAEDVYAGAVLYTDEALRHVQDIMQEAADSVKLAYEKMNAKLQKEKAAVSRDQLELRRHLEDLHDTDKYLKLIEERNRKLEKERAKEKTGAEEPPAFTAPKPEIKINREYFEMAGLELPEQAADEQPEEKLEPVAAEIRVNLDSEYFKWKEGEDAKDTGAEGKSRKPERSSFLGKFLKGEK